MDSFRDSRTELNDAEKYQKYLNDLSFFADNLPQLVWIANHEGFIEYYNKPFLDFILIEQKKLKETGWKSFIHQSDIDLAMEKWFRSIKTGSIFEIELRIKRGKDSEYRWFLSRATPLYDEHKQIIKWLGTNTDIHEKKESEVEKVHLLLKEKEARNQAEIQKNETLRLLNDIEKQKEELKYREEKFRFLAELMPQLVWSANPDGWHDYFNQRWIDYTGMTIQQIQGWGWSHLLHPDDKTRCIETWNNCLKSGEPYYIEYRFKRAKDSTYRWFIGRALPLIDENRKIVKWYGTCTDIQEQKENEEKLEEQRLELLRANQEINKLIYVSSHDLQEPLRAITSYTQLLEKKYKDKLDVEGLEFSELIISSAVRMQELIQDLLDYLSITNSEIKKKICSLNEIVDECLFNISLLIEKSKAKITVDKLPSLKVNPYLIRKLFENLIINSIKYNQNDFAIINISASIEADKWVFAVKDNGIGIESKYFNRIFEIFQRLHTRDKYSGTGIGLSTCKKIVEMHNGNIWVESEEGKGAIFYFSLNAD